MYSTKALEFNLLAKIEDYAFSKAATLAIAHTKPLSHYDTVVFKFTPNKRT